MDVTKIVVVGDPGSGKTQLLRGLCGNLPQESYFLFRAHPDGDAWWYQNGYEDPKVRELRTKGHFTKDNVDWWVHAVANMQMAPILLVDVGGVASDENRRILTEGGVDYAIILTRYEDSLARWQVFLGECVGLKLLRS